MRSGGGELWERCQRRCQRVISVGVLFGSPTVASGGSTHPDAYGSVRCWHSPLAAFALGLVGGHGYGKSLWARCEG
eukprot:4874952-Alexandrium_andersonii.AAC.1